MVAVNEQGMKNWETLTNMSKDQGRPVSEIVKDIMGGTTTPKEPTKSEDTSLSSLISPATTIANEALKATTGKSISDLAGEGVKEITGGKSVSDLLGIGGTPETPSGFLPSGNPSILGDLGSLGSVNLGSLGTLNLGSIGSVGLNLLTNIIGQKMDAPVIPMMVNMLLNPIGASVGAVGAAMKDPSKVTTGIAKAAQTVLGAVPILGDIINGMIGGAFGETPETPISTYDPTTRAMGQGTMVGEFLSPHVMANMEWNKVVNTLNDRIVKNIEEEAKKVGIDTTKGRQTNEMIDPVTGQGTISVEASDLDYSPQVYNMINETLARLNKQESYDAWTQQNLSAAQKANPENWAGPTVPSEVAKSALYLPMLNSTEKKIYDNYIAMMGMIGGPKGENAAEDQNIVNYMAAYGLV
jgi:hypothetical protein